MALVKQSERTIKCKRCGMRGRSGTPEALYWYKDNVTGKYELLHEDGVKHTDRCAKRNGKAYEIPTEQEISKPAVCPVYGFEHKYGFNGECVCGAKSATREEHQISRKEEEPKPSTGNALIDALRDAVGIVPVDEAMVREIVEKSHGTFTQEVVDSVAKLVDSKLASLTLPTVVEIVDRSTFESKKLDGAVHKAFPTVLKALQAGCNVWMVGPAGTGKSTIAHQCAEALSVGFGSISLTVTTPVSEITGYRDANGNYQSTAFRRCYEEGGVFLFDECDNGNANTLGKVNEAISNGSMEFPDARVTKHKDCHIVAAANTYGTGADRQYVGRMQLDAAFLDRFVHISIDIDEALEDVVALAQGGDETQVRSHLVNVRALRRNAQAMRLAQVFSPRASIFGAKLIAAGFTYDQVVQMTLRKGISDQDWSKVREETAL